MQEAKKGICVNIFGSDYVIKGEGDGVYMKELADYVDAKMREITAVTSNVSSLKVAILASLNIADELYKMKKENVDYKKSDEKVDNLIKLFENKNI